LPIWHFNKRLLCRLGCELSILTDLPQRGLPHVLVLHWQGGVHTELCVDRNRPGHHRRVTDVDVIELIQELSKVCIDSTIAATLNRLGYRTGTGKTWRAHSVSSLRYTHRLPNYTKAKDWLTGRLPLYREQW
jgi:hypothetical protein